MNGWGTTFLGVAPDGTALPCHAARMLPGPPLPNVTRQSLRDIWFHSEAFQRFRGTAWMPAPCSGCEQREQDLGGCRCQAYLLTGDPARTDPACERAPEHGRLQQVVWQGRTAPRDSASRLFRTDADSRRLADA